MACLDQYAFLKQAFFEGVIGLSPKALRYPNSLASQLLKLGSSTSRQMVFTFARRFGGSKSIMQVGTAFESKKYSAWPSLKAVKKSSWTLKLEDVLVDGRSLGLCDAGCHALVDTGSSLSAAPSDSVARIAKRLALQSDCSRLDRLPVIR